MCLRRACLAAALGTTPESTQAPRWSSFTPTILISTSYFACLYSKYSDDEDDLRAAGASRRAEERSNRDGRDSRDVRGGDRGGRDADNRDREREPRRSASGTSNRRSKYDNDDDDDELPEDYRRGANKSSSRSGRDNGRDDRDDYTPATTNNNSRSYEDDRDRDRDRDNRPSANKWAGATGGRDVNASQQSSADTNKYKEVTALPLTGQAARAQPMPSQVLDGALFLLLCVVLDITSYVRLFVDCCICVLAIDLLSQGADGKRAS